MSQKCFQPRRFQLNEESKAGRVIAVMSGKGGVGKSLVSALLALGLKRRGHDVGIMDADVTGPSIPKMFGLKGPIASDDLKGRLFPAVTSLGIKVVSLNLVLDKEDDPVIWRGPMMSRVIRQFWEDVVWGELDYMVVDLPPGTADAPLTVLQSLPLAGIVLVTSPQELSAMVVGKAVKMARAVGVPILGLVENMAVFKCPGCGLEHRLFGAMAADDVTSRFNIPLLGSLPLDPEIARLSDAGRIEDFDSAVLGDIINRVLLRLEDM